MQRTLFLAACLSAFSGVCLLILSAIGPHIDVGRYKLSLGSSLTMGLHRGQIVIYGDPAMGPYQGSLVGLTNGQWPKVQGGHRAGLGYVDLRWPSLKIWTVYISLVYPAMLCAMLPAYLLGKRLRRLATTGE